MAENVQAPSDEPRRFPGWPLLFCVLPVVLALGVFALINRPRGNTPAENTPGSRAVPELGAGAQTPAAVNVPRPPANEPAPPDKTPEPAPEPPREVTVGEREIEIHIKNLKFAVQRNNAKGVSLESNWLGTAKPRELVHKGLMAARDAESDSHVRLAFLRCLADGEQELQWARWVLLKWTARFYGTDTQLEAGNESEFGACARVLFSQTPLAEDALALARNALLTGQPPWLLRVLAECMAWGDGADLRAAPLLPELARMLETGGGDARDDLFVAWVRQFKTMDELLRALGDPKMHPALAALLRSDVIAKGLYAAGDDAKLLAFAQSLLVQAGTEKLRAELIAALAHTLPNNAEHIRPIIEAGLSRRDANLPDYLAAFGKLAANTKELARLAEYANETDANVARGAVNGLRLSSLKAADDELRSILESGRNNGVKADALGALLERNPKSRDALVDEYAGDDKAPALRVIAVAHMGEKRLERLKELGENDPDVRVREAAINKLGSFKDKSLKTWFTRVSRSDSVGALRQLAKKYAAELE